MTFEQVDEVMITYTSAELLHRPNVFMVESSSPALAAAVAAPIQKLCPAKSWAGRPCNSRQLPLDTDYIPFSPQTLWLLCQTDGFLEEDLKYCWCFLAVYSHVPLKTVILPDLKKPKMHSVAAAQNIFISTSCHLADHSP